LTKSVTSYAAGTRAGQATYEGRWAQAMAQGPLGMYAFTSPLFRRATTTQAANPAVQDQAMFALTEQARKSTGSYSTAATELGKLSQALGGADSATGRLAQAASDWADSLQAFQSAFKNPAQQLEDLAKSYTSAWQAAHPAPVPSQVQQPVSTLGGLLGGGPAPGTQAPPWQPGKNYVQNYLTTIGAIPPANAPPQVSDQESQRAKDKLKQIQQAELSFAQTEFGISQSIQQYNIEKYRATQSYNLDVSRSNRDFRTSEFRAEQDYHTQVYRSNLDFNISMTRSAQDYHTSVYRSERDFNISMYRSQVEYQVQRRRSLQEFGRQMKEQAESDTQSIYNPFQRVMAQSVMSAGMLQQNLADQNQRIQQQMAQINQLRSMGLSLQAIRGLDLTSSQNAQQVAALVGTVANDPGVIRQINQEMAVRAASTVKLTQSTYNQTFVNQVKDFRIGLDQTAADYRRTRDWARNDQARTLNDMANDYTRTTDRAVADQRRALDEMANDYHRTTQRAQHDQQVALSDMQKNFMISQHQALKDLNIQMTALFHDYTGQYKKTLHDVIAELGPFDQRIANMLARNLRGAHRALVNAARGTGGGGGGLGVGTGAGGGGGGAPLGSAGNPSTNPGTLGVWRGRVGSFGPGGKFHPYQGDPSRMGINVDRLPHIAPPGSYHLNVHRLGGPAATVAGIVGPGTGLGTAAVAGLLGNFSWESGGFQPHITNSIGAYGLAQWLGSRKSNLFRLYGRSPSLAQEAHFVVRELNGPYANVKNELRGVHDPGRAAYIVNRDYEISGMAAESQRENLAQHFYDRMHAAGAVIRGPRYGLIGEAGPEMVLPLDQRGLNYMTQFIEATAKALLTQMNTAGTGVFGQAGPAQVLKQTTNQDYSTKITGPITVKASDPRKMARDLAKMSRFANLALPGQLKH
jgi:hypothetical protein